MGKRRNQLRVERAAAKREKRKSVTGTNEAQIKKREKNASYILHSSPIGHFVQSL